MYCPKCNAWLKPNVPRKSSKGLKGVKIICKCGYKAECIDWNKYISSSLCFKLMYQPPIDRLLFLFN